MPSTSANQISRLKEIRQQLHTTVRQQESEVLKALVTMAGMSESQRKVATQTATKLVNDIRADDEPGLMEAFLAQYGLSTDEGVALMCLAEALLRVPDNATIDELVEDKIVPSSWGEHLGKSTSSLVNAATWGLLFTGKVLDDSVRDDLVGSLRTMVKRLGEPVIRVAVKSAMKEMGRQFVSGESIESALEEGETFMQQGYTYSYDMLGEAALTHSDATHYFEQYKNAIKALGAKAVTDDIRDNPGISIKLSALHPRYEYAQRQRVLTELVPTVLQLAQLAKIHNLGFNIDAEEADRLDISLDVVQAVFEDSSLAGWHGFGVVVQAYNKSAPCVLDWLYELSKIHNRRIMVRLVKGAYWDSEIKRAQVESLSYFPVYTRKAATDVSYLCCANKLLSMADRIYPQFATHNAHTVAAVMEIADDNAAYEFQRLHGMGEAVYKNLLAANKVSCRIYAPVGEHRDLLAYLVRRLLENGANSSFVNQIVDLDIPVADVVLDPFAQIESIAPTLVKQPSALYLPERTNSIGWDLHNEFDLDHFLSARRDYKTQQWYATPLLAAPHTASSTLPVINPANPADTVGEVIEANEADLKTALALAKPWIDCREQRSDVRQGSSDRTKDAIERAKVLNRVADLYEQNSGEIFAILAREAGKTPLDAVAEIREAVDFLRYYSAQIKDYKAPQARGTFVCISPWNFPLAIFTGQISAALAAGNAVLAKPAETTPLVAFFAIKLFYKAGVPKDVLQLLPGQGHSIGADLVSATQIAGVCFTGSTNTALSINRAMAEHMQPNAPLIAETGGLNAMIVDSTALPEQAVQDIVKSAFQSAGQRCSALRILYLQEDIYDSFTKMLYGAMDQLKVGDPWQDNTDIGPLISAQARDDVQNYIDQAAGEGRLLKNLNTETPTGHFVSPSVIHVNSISDLSKEIFGPVLHIAKYASDELQQIVADINNSDYGLTFGLHTRIDSRVEQLVNSLKVGNIYVNRDQIGAVVGCQPFGGENLSGTGPKAGGPNYLKRFLAPRQKMIEQAANKESPVSLEAVQDAINQLTHAGNTKEQQARIKIKETEMPGPTGESNMLYEYARGLVLCLGATTEAAYEQAEIAKAMQCQALIVCPGAIGDNAIDGFLPRELLTRIKGVQLFALWSDNNDLAQARQALAKRDGAIMPLVSEQDLAQACVLERHVCVDTTAAGGNASLLALVS